MKQIVLIIILVIINLITYSQNNYKGFSTYIKSGYSASNMTGDVKNLTLLLYSDINSFRANSSAGSLFRKGITFGAGFEYRFFKYIAIQIDANYAPKGCKINVKNSLGGVATIEGTAYWKQNYITIPFTARIYFWKEFYLSGGIFVDFLLNSYEYGDIKIEGQSDEYRREKGANEKDYGYAAGLGYKYAITNKHSLLIDFRGYRSLLSYGRDYTPHLGDYYNQMFEVSLGYSYKF